MGKITIFDTNVLLSSYEHIFNYYGDTQIYIPIFVLEELDRLKTLSGTAGYQARQVIRTLESLLSGYNAASVVLPGGGTLHIYALTKRTTTLADNNILDFILDIQEHNPHSKVTFITNDINLKLKALALKIITESFTSPPSIRHEYAGHQQRTQMTSEFIDTIYKFSQGIALDLDPVPNVNEYILFKNGKQSALTKYTADGLIKRVEAPREGVCGVNPANLEQVFALDALLDNNIPLVTITGKAGTGKTLLALAAALQKRRDFINIYVARPTVPLSNKDIGYLPGDIKSKLDPFMQPIYDNLNYIKEVSSVAVDKLLAEEKIVVAPLAYIRGRTLPRKFFLIDEAQNLTIHEMKTIVTRAGTGTKLVFTGDVDQIDLPNLNQHNNGLSYLIDKFKGDPLFAHITLKKGERSPLATRAAELL